MEPDQTGSRDASPPTAGEPSSATPDSTQVIGEPANGPPADCAATSTPLPQGYARYNSFRSLGAGGIGIVNSCRDPNLGRRVAVKHLHGRFQADCRQRARFLQEARITAQLEHPNIVPVHELGMRPDGGIYFTMKQIQGETLRQILTGLVVDDPDSLRRYPLDRLLDIFIHICQAVAFAHHHGILHRDLKPGNIQVGSFGEVLVLDWGLAKIIDAAPAPTGGQMDIPPAISASVDNSTDGSVSGTLRYMPPEQARGDVSKLDRRSDVYSLGAILYEMLTLQPAIAGHSLREIRRHVLAGAIAPPRQRAGSCCLPKELACICMTALAREQENRYASVEALIDDVQAFREDRIVSVCPPSPVRRLWKWCRRRPVLSSTVVVALLVGVTLTGAVILARHLRYRQLVARGDAARRHGHTLFEQQAALQHQLNVMCRARTSKFRDARELRVETALGRVRRKMQNAYETAFIAYAQARDQPDDPRLRRRFAEIFRHRLRAALAARNYDQAARWLDFLRQSLGAHFEHAGEAERQRLRQAAAQVRGDGSLAVTSRPDGAEVTLSELVEDDLGVRRPRRPRPLGRTPFRGVILPKGSYLLTLTPAARPPVLRPVMIDHGETEVVDVQLPESIPEGMIYVPGGPFKFGGEHARYHCLHERDEPAFFMRTTEVTFGEYLAFWMTARDPDRRRRLMSRIRWRRADRVFTDAWDADGNLRAPLRPDQPAVGITQAAAVAYCRWLAARTGKPYRLPTAAQWEKAARGVDGRQFVWGNTYAPNYAFTAENTDAAARFRFWAPGGSFPLDRSIYGALDMAGNVREWTASRFPDGSPFYQIKGASGATTRRFVYCASASDTPVAPSDVGFRYILPAAPEQPAP